jgi:hypothetical protein
MPRHDDPADTTPEERLEELAALFAAGLMRLPKRTRVLLAERRMAPAGHIENSSQKALEVCGLSSPDPERG